MDAVDLESLGVELRRVEGILCPLLVAEQSRAETVDEGHEPPICSVPSPADPTVFFSLFENPTQAR